MNMKKSFAPVKSILPVLMLAVGLFAIDGILSFGAEARLNNALENTGNVAFWSWCYFLRDTICFGLALASLPFLLGKWSRFILIPAFCLISLMMALTKYGNSVWHMDLGFVWLPLVLCTNREEAWNFLCTLDGVGGGGIMPDHPCRSGLAGAVLRDVGCRLEG